MGIKTGGINSVLPSKTQTVTHAPQETRGAWLLLALMLAPILGICGVEMARLWQSDTTLSHAPLLVLIALYCLYQRRDRLRSWNAANPAGFALMLFSAIVFALASRVDVLFLKSFGLFGLLTGCVWFLGGLQTLRAAGGSLGLLLFTIPWPAAIITRFQFFLQIASSSYAALLAGLLGIPVQRDGVSLSVIPPGAEKPVYSILVAQKCSGLGSFLALLALSYLIAWHSPLPNWRRLPLVLLIFPMALLANALRLSLILFAGTHGNVSLAQWVHDNEQPVLMLFCGVGLGIVRWTLLQWSQPQANRDGGRQCCLSIAFSAPMLLCWSRYSVSFGGGESKTANHEPSPISWQIWRWNYRDWQTAKTDGSSVGSGAAASRLDSDGTLQRARTKTGSK